MANDWIKRSVIELQEDGVLLVEDGNHGEYRPRRDEFADEGHAFIRAADMDAGQVLFRSAQRINATAFARIRKGVGRDRDVLFSHKGTVGKLAFVPENSPPFVCSPQTTFWRSLDEEKLDCQFLYYFLQSHAFRSQWSARKGETDMADYVSLTAQRTFWIPLPPLSKQRAIAGVLRSLDDKIEQNRQTAATLEELARATFRAWFVDFAPVHAKAAGRTAYPGLPPAAFAALPDRLTDSPLGPIPEGWGVETIAKLADHSKEQIKPQDHPDEAFEHFSIPAFDAGKEPVREAGESIKSGKFIVPRGCVMISKLNPRIPRIWLPAVSGSIRAIASTEFIVLQPCERFDRSFLFGLLTQAAFLNELERQASGTSNSHQRIKPRAFMGTPIVLPPVALRDVYGETVGPMIDLVQHGRHESRQLAGLRDYLLPQLLSGVVRVPEHAFVGSEIRE